jgi:hypothetical protein
MAQFRVRLDKRKYRTLIFIHILLKKSPFYTKHPTAFVCNKAKKNPPEGGF